MKALEQLYNVLAGVACVYAVLLLYAVFLVYGTATRARRIVAYYLGVALVAGVVVALGWGALFLRIDP